MFNIIAACDDCGGIGKDGQIPWSGTPIGNEDLTEFRAKTLHGVIIMGRKTYQSIGKPLNLRCNIIVSRDEKYRVCVHKQSAQSAQSTQSQRATYTLLTAHNLATALAIAADQIREYAPSNTTYMTTAHTDANPACSSRSSDNNRMILTGGIWVIGGAELYTEALAHPKLHRAYISRISGDWRCDVFMPPVRLQKITCELYSNLCIDVYGNDDEDKYLQLMKRLMAVPLRSNRTGIPTHGLFAERLEFSLTRGNVPILPLLTTKRVPVKMVITELLWFVSGKCTDTSKLLAENCHIWDDNTTRAFLDSRGLTDYIDGECGPIYGYQWRSWNRPYVQKIKQSVEDDACTTLMVQTAQETTTQSTTAQSTNQLAGIDQLAGVIETLRKDPFDRRMIVSAWNPEQIPEMALPPCHWSFQFHCEALENSGSVSGTPKYSLNCLVNMRSADVALGVPFNIASYALLTHMVAKCVNMRPGRLVIMMADCHLYQNHLEGAREQVNRLPGQFPTIEFCRDITAGGSIDQFTSCDQFIIGTYQPHGVIKYPMAV